MLKKTDVVLFIMSFYAKDYEIVWICFDRIEKLGSDRMGAVYK